MKKIVMMGAFLLASVLVATAQTTTNTSSNTNQSTGVATYPDPQSVPSSGGDNAAQGVQSSNGAKKYWNKQNKKSSKSMGVTTYPDPQSVPSSGSDDSVMPGSNSTIQSGRNNRSKNSGKMNRRSSTTDTNQQ